MESYQRTSRKISIFKKGYVGASTLLTLMILATPLLTRHYFAGGNTIFVAEAIFECSLLALLLLVGYGTTKIYRDQIEKSQVRLHEASTDIHTLERRLSDTFKYIGKLNVQVHEIESIFRSINRYPRDKKDFQNVLSIVARTALSIVDVEWVEFRFIDLVTLRTIREYSEARTGKSVPCHSAANRALVEGRNVPAFSITGSEWENLTVKAFCILPIDLLMPRDQVLIKVLVNELEMLFVIFSSQYSKDNFQQVRL